MTRLSSLVFAVLAVILFAGMARAGNPYIVQPNAAYPFATLPDGVRFPEGIAVNPSNEEVYVGTFDFGPNPNALLRFSKTGALLAVLDFGATPLLGLAYNTMDDKIYIANFGASEIQRVAADFSTGSVVETVAVLLPGIGAPAPRIETNNPDLSQDIITFGSNNFPAPNAMTFDSSGALYVSDSFQGAIYRIDTAHSCGPCQVVTVAHDPLLATAGYPPFGANGIDLNADESALFIANTGDDRILSLDLATNTVNIFAESINGADGIAFDEQGSIWVVANQADQITVLDSAGRVIAELGEFLGVNQNGTARGLSFPASLAIVNNKVLVTNLALPISGPTDPESSITRYTIAQINAPRF